MITEEMKSFLNEYHELLDKYSVEVEVIESDGWEKSVKGIEFQMWSTLSRGGHHLRDKCHVILPKLHNDLDVKVFLNEGAPAKIKVIVAEN